MNCILSTLLLFCTADDVPDVPEPELTSAQRILSFGEWQSTTESEPVAGDAAASPKLPTQLPLPSSEFEPQVSCRDRGVKPRGRYTPPLLGDMIGKFGTRLITVNGGPDGIHRVPILATSGGIKATDVESPRPTDRVYYAFNFFGNTTIDVDPTVPPVHLNRHVIGLEKTFLNDYVSLGLRLPFVDMGGYREITQASFADMSFIAKLALINNRETGNVLSGGLVLTFPTGPDAVLDDIMNERGGIVIHPVQFQPFIGWVLHARNARYYLQGFTSIIVPSDVRDVIVFWNDVAAGMWLYQAATDDQTIQGVIPTLEVHVNTPLNQRGAFASPLGYPDIVNLTAGGYVLFRRSVLGVAAGTPLSWPRPFSMELVTTYSLRF